MSQKEKELSDLCKKNRDIQQGRIAHDSQDRLKRIADKKFRTCFIAALAAFENTFGLELWGHNLPQETLTPVQSANKQRWEQVRKDILDKGNAQSRALGMEIDLHRIEFEGYQMDFGGRNNEQ